MAVQLGQERNFVVLCHLARAHSMKILVDAAQKTRRLPIGA